MKTNLQQKLQTGSPDIIVFCLFLRTNYNTAPRFSHALARNYTLSNKEENTESIVATVFFSLVLFCFVFLSGYRKSEADERMTSKTQVPLRFPAPTLLD